MRFMAFVKMAEDVGDAPPELIEAMGQEITLADGMVEQSNFHDFDSLRGGHHRTVADDCASGLRLERRWARDRLRLIGGRAVE